jgi:hypothetical protein
MALADLKRKFFVLDERGDEELLVGREKRRARKVFHLV